MDTRSMPDIIVTTELNPEPFQVLFSDLYALKNKIKSLLFLWDYNSYYVNVEQGYFIINGGRRIQPTITLTMTDKIIEYAKRNRVDVTLDNNENINSGEVQSSYLLGIIGKDGTENKSILIHISPDGSLWGWKDKR